MVKKLKKVTIKIPNINYWMILSFILIALLVVSWFYKGFKVSFSTQSPNEVGQKVINFINSRLVRPGTSAKLIGVKDLGSIYEIDTSYQGRNISVYATKDGKMMFLSAFKLTTTSSTKTTSSSSNANTNSQNIPKSKVPDVKLFVMSYCPFGLQAEKALLPVMKLLGNKANITIHFVYYSMHSNKANGFREVYENLRQYCIQKDQRDKYYKYLLCFVQTGNYTKCLKEADVNIQELNKCMEETDKEYHVTADINNRSTWISGIFPPFNVELALNRKYNVQGSPTLVINGKVVEITRSPEAFKEAICSAFINPPSVCNQKLSNSVTSPGIGPLNITSSNSGGSCG